MDVRTSAGWKGEEELAAAPRRTEDGGKVSQLFPPLLMVVVLLHAEQQQLKHSARAPEFMGNQPIEPKKRQQWMLCAHSSAALTLVRLGVTPTPEQPPRPAETLGGGCGATAGEQGG